MILGFANRGILALPGFIPVEKEMKDRANGRQRRYGFVTTSARKEALAAIAALNGADVDGRTLMVNVAQPREVV